MAAATASEKRELFEGHNLFGQLSRDDLDTLLSHARVENYRAGHQIFAKGSPGRNMMAILRGSIRISAPSTTGREIVLTSLEAGEIFGEISLIDGQDRTADATAVTDIADRVPGRGVGAGILSSVGCLIRPPQRAG